MNLFDVIHVHHDFGNGPVLDDITFSLTEGSSFGIIGPNGSGKSTLVRTLSSLLIPQQGEVLFRDSPLKSYRKKELAKQIAVLEQEGTPSIPFTVEKVVAMGRYPWLKPFSDLTLDDQEIVEQTLKTLDLWSMRSKPVNTLSGGQRQLVSLARAMAQQPEILILDEPTTYLDIGHQILVMEHIKKWHEEKNITLIMVLHDLNLAGQYCNELLLMDHGRIRALGSVNEVLKAQTIGSVYGTELIMIEHPKLGVPQFLLSV